MNESRVIKIGEHEYVMAFPSLRLLKRLGELLEVDVIREGLKNYDFSALLEDDQRLNEVMKVVLGDKINPDAVLADMTAGDVKFCLLAFFLKANQIHATSANGLNDFADSLNQAMLPKLRVDSPSTLPSIE